MMKLVEARDDKQSLPDGTRRARRSSEVAEVTRRRPDDCASDPDLCLCGQCGSKLVQPIDWAMVGRRHWRVTLHCPNCEWSGTGIFTQVAIDRYDRELDRGMRKLNATLTRVSRACMEEEIEIFAKALDSDLIVPFDF